MRWIWIDRFLEFASRKSAVAVKNVTLAEEHLHDLFPAYPIVPHTLIIEGMAQTAGILVGESREFKEKVILAKITRATFHQIVRPSDTLLFSAKIESLSEHGASISGVVSLGSAAANAGQPAAADLVAEIELMFSHVDKNMAGVQFPEHNFVFTDQFMDLLQTYRQGARIEI